MTNIILMPILIPLLTATLLMFFGEKILLQRWISLFSSILTAIASTIVLIKVKHNGIQTLALSSWDAPFGITLVSDMLSALLVFMTSIILLMVLLYSFNAIDEKREAYYYYPITQFLITGVNGAFTTGDIFNLFVFFEVMLMSSYVLIVLGGTKIQLRESIKYILVNVVSSALFVVAVAFLYSVVGTLNMAHIAVRIQEVNQPGIISVIAILFLIVFGLKGALFPLFFWLPGSYYAPPIPIMALFGALLTKVGVYSILRSFTLLFPHDLGFTHQILLVMSIFTILVGCVGAVAFFDLKKIIIYNIMIAVGVITFGISVMTFEAISGTIFYLIHDMNIKAALILLIGMIINITSTSNLKEFRGLIKDYPVLAWTFFIAALVVSGIPPFSGFLGKLLLVRSGFEAGHYLGAVIVILSSLIVLFSMMKIFIRGFWGESTYKKKAKKVPVQHLMIAPVILVFLAIYYGVGAEFILPYIFQATETLTTPEIYINAVLKGE